MTSEKIIIEKPFTYPILLREDFSFSFKEISKEQDHILFCEENLRSLFSREIDYLLSHFPSMKIKTFLGGEKNKSRQTKEKLEDWLIEEKVTRNATFWAIGGGMTLDLIGFLAATYMRGVSTVYIPTTLLAMVDATIGGKTAINHPRGKNLIGCFHSPQSVYLSTHFLQTLPEKELLQGRIEHFKHLFLENKEDEEKCQSISLETMTLSLSIKKSYVESDYFDKANRQLLNAGHTIGHALEMWGNSFKISHGEAVGIGLVLEALFFEKKGLYPQGISQKLYQNLNALGLNLLQYTFCPSEIWPYLEQDKKKTDSRIVIKLPDKESPRKILEATLSREELSTLINDNLVALIAQSE